MERYDYKTAMQYAVLATDSVETKTTQKNDVSTTKTDNTLPQQTAPPQNSQNGQHNLTHTNFVERRQIGFYSQGQRMSENLLQQNTQTAQTGQSSKQDDPNAKIVYNDRYTILHNGQKTKQRYTLARNKKLSKNIHDRENKAREKGKRSVAEHNAKQVKYWQERERELLEKLKYFTLIIHYKKCIISVIMLYIFYYFALIEVLSDFKEKRGYKNIRHFKFLMYYCTNKSLKAM